MNLNDLAPKLDSKKLSEAYSSQFGKKVNAAAVSHEAAVRMLRETRERIAEIKSSRSGHYRETNPAYLKLMFMEQALSARVAESQPESKVKVMNSKAKYMNAVKTVAVGGKLTESEIAALGVSKNLAGVLESREAAVKFMRTVVEASKCKGKKKAMNEKFEMEPTPKSERGKYKGKTVAELRKSYNALKDKEDKTQAEKEKMAELKFAIRAKTGWGKVNEGTEVDQAQVVLAAQDMVDQVQKMIENMTDLKVKELPALVDGIKGEQGVDAAGQFQSAVDSALQGLIDALGGAKGELESAVGVITGEEMTVPGEEMGMGAELGMGAEMPAEPAPEMEPEMPEEEPDDELSNLGRERI